MNHFDGMFSSYDRRRINRGESAPRVVIGIVSLCYGAAIAYTVAGWMGVVS